MVYARTTSAFVLALVFVLLMAFLPQRGSAAELRAGDQPSIEAGETIREDIYIAGGNVSSAGIVAEDLIAAGGNVLIKGPVGGDLAAAGGSVTVLGNVADDLRAVAGNLLLQGTVGGDAVLAGGQLTIGGNIAGDLILGGGTVRVDAPIKGDVRIGGGDVYLNSAISGNVEVYADKVTLGSGARISGNFSYTAATEVTMEEGATVSGETTFTKREQTISVGSIVAVVSLALIGTLLSQLACGLLLGLVFRRYAMRLVETAAAKPLLEVGRGLVVMIVFPVASMMLIWTVLGAPLGILGFLGFGLTMIYMWIMTPVLLGSFAYRSFFGGEFDVNWKTILLGVLIYTILGIIPIVGWLAELILMLLTLGATAKVKWEIAKEWR